MKAAQPIDLKVNQDKKKIVFSRRNRNIADLIVSGTTFQAVNDFKYLDTNINKSNNIHNEIILRILAINKEYFA